MPAGVLNVYCPCGCFNDFQDQPSDVIKIYKHWVLYLHFKQEFPGRCLAILKAHKIDLIELTEAERQEFFQVYGEWRNAISTIAPPYNIHVLTSNTESGIHGGHFHWHLIPRYDKPAEIGDLTLPCDSEADKKLFYNRLEKNSVCADSDRRAIAEKIRMALTEP